MAQSTTSGTSSRRHGRDHDSTSIASSRFVDTEWEANEAMRQRELEEARARAAQMEKTMRWWSDCTANWREKWSKVRNERNKAREESKQLRSKLEAALKDTSSSKREKQDLELQNEQLKKEIEKIHILLLKHAGQFDSHIFEALGDDPLKDFNFSLGNNSPIKENNDVTNGLSATQVECDSTATSIMDLDKDSAIEEYILQGAVPKHVLDSRDLLDKRLTDSTEILNGLNGRSDKIVPKDMDEEYIMQKLSMLQLRLDEATKTLQIEREEKVQLHRNIEKLTGDLQEAKEKCDELRDAKQEAVRDLLQLQDQHQEELRVMRSDLQEESQSRENLDRRINELRTELERLQAENAAEWGKRERLETEKLALERENKKLRSELRDMQERMERKGRPMSNADAELRHLQQEVSDKAKEIADLKHSQNKLKKIVQDKMSELAHAVRRAEQYESEVKKLRSRVEELKRDLAVAEDELDTATNNTRKLQRTNDELQEQVDNFQVQLQHLHTSEEKEDGGEEMALLEDSDCVSSYLEI
ncbi:coiled-coil domain-containing protein [Holotrichia oblita]|uniref:Coiled-coil domain-containing protein n=1 Tax=Holotrichia oblita TaxID=644536 RepID=A0ACB9TRU3_HOLOL|nr:coiled-coil domain-containing protein [Holotrichia oblita]